MRKVFYGLIILGCLVSGNQVYSQNISLDAAIADAANSIRQSVPPTTRIALLNIEADSKRLSDYIVDELIGQLVNRQGLQVVPRSAVELQAAQSELNFQMSGHVSDESIRSIGRFLGAETIITGRITQISGSYRLSINTIDLESFAYRDTYVKGVNNDSNLRSLVGDTTKTLQENLIIGAKNIAFGLGSYMERDWLGGAIVTAGEVIGISLIIWEKTGIKYDDSIAGVPGNIGVGMIGLSVLFGFVRPFFYEAAPNVAGIYNDTGINLALVPEGHNKNTALLLSYKLRY